MESSSYGKSLLINEEVGGMQEVDCTNGLISDADREEGTWHPLCVETEVLCAHDQVTKPDIGIPEQAFPYSLYVVVHPFVIDSHRICNECVLREVQRGSTLIHC